MRNLMSKLNLRAWIRYTHKFLWKTVMPRSIVGGCPVLFSFQLYAVSVHVHLIHSVLYVLVCYVVRERIIAKHSNCYSGIGAT